MSSELFPLLPATAAAFAGALAELGVTTIDADGLRLATRHTDLPRALLSAPHGTHYRWDGGEARVGRGEGGGTIEWSAIDAHAAVIRAALAGGPPP